MKLSKPISSATRSGVKDSRLDSVSRLRDLQRLMAGAIMRPLTRHDGAQSRWLDGRSMRRMAGGFIKPNDRLTSFERLEIYNRQYWFRLIDSFHQDFPGLRAVIGDHKFNALARAYLATHPSISFTLRNLGSRLETFLRAEPQWISPRAELALDMVRFEWAQIIGFDGGWNPPLMPQDILGRKASRLRLRLQPCITLLDLQYPVDDLLLACRKRRTSQSTASNAMDGNHKTSHRNAIRLPRPEKVFVAVHRIDNTLYYKRLDPIAYQILAALRDGVTVTKACADAIGAAADEARDWPDLIQRWFQNWTALGWFCKRA